MPYRANRSPELDAAGITVRTSTFSSRDQRTADRAEIPANRSRLWRLQRVGILVPQVRPLHAGSGLPFSGPVLSCTVALVGLASGFIDKRGVGVRPARGQEREQAQPVLPLVKVEVGY